MINKILFPRRIGAEVPNEEFVYVFVIFLVSIATFSRILLRELLITDALNFTPGL